MKCCLSTDVRTWKNCLIFEPDPDHSPDAGTRLHRIGYGTLQPCLGCQRDVLLRRVLCRGNPSTPLERAMVLKWFYSLSRRKTFVGGTCALPSALLVVVVFDEFN